MISLLGSTQQEQQSPLKAANLEKAAPYLATTLLVFLLILAFAVYTSPDAEAEEKEQDALLFERLQSLKFEQAAQGELILKLARMRGKKVSEAKRAFDLAMKAAEMGQVELAPKVKVEPGVHFFADYDATQPRLPFYPSKYAYGHKPAFKYIDDIPYGGGAKYPHVVLSHMPKVYYFPRFLSDEEADAIIAASEKKFRRSEVALFSGEKAENEAERLSDVRTSQGAWLDDDVPAVRKVRDRIQNVTAFKRTDFELLQILKYALGQKYDSHHDFFHPSYYPKQDWNRAATLFMYLSDAEGGETVIPRANGQKQPSDLTSCESGLRVRPRKGAAILLYDMRPDGALDTYSLHGGCKVKSGTKYGAVQWLRVDGEAKVDDQ
eukprot:Sspe_Gene.80946::Locus_51452_Transcript_4_4_Confidence_0.400_Length_1331::g.80946::m.80946/K00472/P4HA; prolyl 4-hydroxylase